MANLLGSLGGLQVIPVDIDRLMKTIERRCTFQPDGCLVWTGYCLKGYPQSNVCGKSRLLHRALYIGVHGPIPKGMQVDHRCNNSRCLNIIHLQLKTPKGNALRSNNPCAQHARRTSCIHGHLFDRTRTDRKGRLSRVCSTCEHIRAKARWQRDKLKENKAHA